MTTNIYNCLKPKRIYLRKIDWNKVLPLAEGLSQAEITRVADEAIKEAILAGKKTVATSCIVAVLNARKIMRDAVADIFKDG